MNGLQIVVESLGYPEFVICARDYHTAHSAYEAFILTPGIAPYMQDVITVRLTNGRAHIIEKPVSAATAAEILDLPERTLLQMVRTRRRLAPVRG